MNCNCRTCWTAEILAEAQRAIETTNQVQVLRSSLMRVVAVLQQREQRYKRLRAADDQMVTCQLPGCGRLVRQRPTGRKRKWCTDAHRAEAYRRRRDQIQQNIAHSVTVDQSSSVGVERELLEVRGRPWVAQRSSR